MMKLQFLSLCFFFSLLVTGMSAQSNRQIRSLQSKKSELQKKINQSEQLLKSTKADVKSQLSNLVILNGQISEKQKQISGIQADVKQLDGHLQQLEIQLKALQKELTDRKLKYQRSALYMYRNRSMQNKLMFILSAETFTQMFRRMRYMREYARYQRVQGEQVQRKEIQVSAKQNEVLRVRSTKSILLGEERREHEKLAGQQKEKETIVSGLQKKQTQLQRLISSDKKKYTALNAQIDYLIKKEIEAAERRRKEEQRKKAAAEARARAAAERKAKTAAEAKARAAREAAEKARREAAEKEAAAREARAAEKAAKDEASRKRAAREVTNREKAAQRAAERAEVARRKAVREQEVADRESEIEEMPYTNTSDARLSRNFTANKGRLPMPITGSYVISSRYGQYSVEGLKGVQLDNKGINITGHRGAQARAIFNGEVSAVFSFGGFVNVLIRHGSYISVYCNLASASVRKGQQVNTRDIIGTVAADPSGNCTLHFQLRKETTKLNPEVWLGR